MKDRQQNHDTEQASLALIDGLHRSDAFPHDVRHLEIIETHISWIILTGELAYKIKKPLDLGFLNFSTLELRWHYCHEELRLNRRFAPQLYLDVVPIGGTLKRPRIGAEPAIEWAVRMHQFPVDRSLDRRLAAEDVSVADMHQLGETVAAGHSAATVAVGNDYGTLASILGPAGDNFTSLIESGPQRISLDDITMLRDWSKQEAARLEPVFAERVLAKHIRECHGDLHVGNIAWLNGEYFPFDCLEFNPLLRWIDVINDVAFLVMDLLHRDRSDLAFVFLNRYLECTGDYAGLAVLPYYLVYRAVVRAKITAIRHLQQSPAPDSARIDAYIELACRIVNPRQKPLLIICRGLSGSGKTWLSDRMIPAVPAIRLRSDVIRKQLHGLGELARSDSKVSQGLYSSDKTQRTYALLGEFATLALNQGLNVIIDASCLRRNDRLAFQEIACAAGADFVIVQTVAPRAVLEERISRRHRDVSDASEADLAVLEFQLASEEPLGPDERVHSLSVETSQVGEVDALMDEIRQRALTDTGTL